MDQWAEICSAVNKSPTIDCFATGINVVKPNDGTMLRYYGKRANIVDIDQFCIEENFLRVDHALMSKQELYYMFPPAPLESKAIRIAIANELPAIIISSWSNFPTPDWVAVVKESLGEIRMFCEPYSYKHFILGGRRVQARQKYRA